jgi:ABC-type uncharacterized transport system substrate-binding protein
VTYATGVPAAQRATTTIPIVMAVYANVDIVANIARPGGNITGSTFFHPELMAKRLELLKEVVPSMTRAGVLLLRRDDNASNRNDRSDGRDRESFIGGIATGRSPRAARI